MELLAKKSLGQHFLNSPSVLAKIVEAAALKAGDLVLEIGPGTGILTRALLNAGAKVVAVEKDDRAYGLIKEKFAKEVSSGSLTIISGDILETDKEKIGLSDKKYSLVANIPYYITGMILESFLEHEPRPEKMVLLVQKEVAERIVARDGKESVLSMSVKAFGQPKIVAKGPRGAFNPPPTVDSAILAIEGISGNKFAGKSLEIRLFFTILKAGFAHKRKYLKSNLKECCTKSDLDEKWLTYNLDEKIRAEDLSLPQWLNIASGLDA